MLSLAKYLVSFIIIASFTELEFDQIGEYSPTIICFTSV